MKKYTKAAGLFVSVMVTSAVLSGTVGGQVRAATSGRKAGAVSGAQAADQSVQVVDLRQDQSYSTNSRKAG